MIKKETLIKKDTSENWNKAKNFIPKEDEILIYTDLMPNGIKIGNGKTFIKDLPFINEQEYSVNDNGILIIH